MGSAKQTPTEEEDTLTTLACEAQRRHKLSEARSCTTAQFGWRSGDANSGKGTVAPLTTEAGSADRYPLGEMTHAQSEKGLKLALRRHEQGASERPFIVAREPTHWILQLLAT